MSCVCVNEKTCYCHSFKTKPIIIWCWNQRHIHQYRFQSQLPKLQNLVHYCFFKSTMFNLLISFPVGSSFLDTVKFFSGLIFHLDISYTILRLFSLQLKSLFLPKLPFLFFLLVYSLRNLIPILKGILTL